ncbi:NAD(P)-dependent alcohol dehydrogenase [Cohnella sp. GCM10027633]|uniref:NAD(P)-dependent alcohol dehydrogenase n=1 Tax=unclassified Cohnella TaxID=2636738 RepID=UPI003639A285
MKAVICTRYGPPEVLRLADLDTPAPKDNEIRVRIFATTVTASDCIIRGFKVPPRFRIPMALAIGFRKPRKSVLGMVFAGEVDAVGKRVREFAIGDRVYGIDRFGFGAYAEYKCVREDGVVVKLASDATYEDAAALPFGGLLALHYLKKGNIRTGQRIVVYGASGAIGTSAVQLANYFGAEVTGVCSAANADMVKSLGAHKVIDYKKEDFTASGERYDLILNAVGKAKARLRCDSALAPNGKHITVDDGSPPLRVEDLSWLNDRLAHGHIRAVIDRRYPLEEVPEAHRYVDLGHKKGNVIIQVAR